jgi:hypothetical protein
VPGCKRQQVIARPPARHSGWGSLAADRAANADASLAFAHVQTIGLSH